MEITPFIENFGAAGILMFFTIAYLWINHQSRKRSDELMKESLKLNANFQLIQSEQNRILDNTRERLVDALEAMNKRYDVLEIKIAKNAQDVDNKLDEIKAVLIEKI